MKTIVVLGVVLLILSVVMTVLTEDGPVMSGSSDDVHVDYLPGKIRVKRASCTWYFYWRVTGTASRTEAQITASLRNYFKTVVCR